MKGIILTILFLICTTQAFYSQEEDGVVSLALPIRSSLTFNQHIINPTFSFVRQQYKYVSLTNKREWVQFEDAPQTYLVSYSGRFRENIGAGVSVFQQNYGVLTTFGGVLNFAYNARLNRDSNLTFGLNVGAYKSGINSGSVVTNFTDPSLENIPSNFMLSVNPGINYGTAFIDFGVSVNNLVLYNFNSSQLINDNPEQSVQAHIMYTGYMDSRGFFDQSKFSGLVKSEFKKDKTIISGIAMITVPKGIWAQVGYNNLYGASGGIGLNITNQIAIEYNFEKALGDLTDFGPSHEITLAYKFKNRENYDYSAEDEVSALISPKRKIKPLSKVAKAEAEANRILSQEAKAQAKLDAEAKKEEETLAKTEEENKAKTEEENKAKQEAEEKAKQEVERQENKAKAEEEARAAKLAEEARAKEIEAIKAKIAADNKAKADAEAARLKAVTEAEAKKAAEEKARIEAENKAKADAELAAEKAKQQQAEIDAEIKVKADAEAEELAQETAKLKEEDKAITDTEVKEEKPLAKQDSIVKPTDEIGISMDKLNKLTETSKTAQDELLEKLNKAIDRKDKDLKDLKEENDLSEQGIYLEPKPFKSVTAENNAIEVLKEDLDQVIEVNNQRIKELENLYDERSKIDTLENDMVYVYYQKALSKLKSEQRTAINTRARLLSSLEQINVATEFERKRRIKRALYDNEQDRFTQDKAVLNSIKQNTPLSSEPLTAEDFDFGEEQSDNIKILKNVNNIENGFYVILAVHNDVAKRDEFLRNAVAAGEKNINFFYDVNTSKYYIYYESFDNIQAANNAMKQKGSKPYNANISLVKIEN